ncbi:MAG: hypothetical protein ACEPOV_04505 [Hyphomicrobiales bacterium]
MKIKYISIIAICLIAVVLLFLQSLIKGMGETVNLAEKKMELVVYDSIDLKDGSEFQVKSYNPKTGLYTLIRDKSIVGFNKEGKVFSFNKFGKGPDEYNFSSSYVTCPRETNEGSVYINSDNYLKSFDSKGELLSSKKIDDDVYYAGRILLGRDDSDDNIFYFRGKGPAYLRKEDPDPNVYSDSPSFFSFNVKDNSIHLYGQGMEENLLQKEINVYSMIFPEMSYNSQTKDVGILYGSSKEFFSIPLDTTKEVSSFKLSPSFFNITVPEKRPESDLGYRMLGLKQAAYGGFYYNADTLITKYRASFSDELLDKHSEEIADPSKYDNFYNSFVKYYLDIYVNKKKVSDDLLVPKPYQVALIGDANNILLYKTGEELTIDNKPVKRLYFARLQ